MAHRILVIEDDTQTSETIRLYLENDGFDVDVAADGQTGLELALRDRPVLVVLDLMLPRLSGSEVCRAIRKRSNVPIVMLTARTTEDDRIQGLELGADDYVPKPFSPRLRRRLRRARAYGRRTHHEPAQEDRTGPDCANLRRDGVRPGVPIRRGARVIRSLRARLTLAIVVITLAASTVVGVGLRRFTTHEFRQFLEVEADIESVKAPDLGGLLDRLRAGPRVHCRHPPAGRGDPLRGWATRNRRHPRDRRRAARRADEHPGRVRAGRPH